MIKILATGDLHFGRTLGKYADDEADHISTFEMWNRIVDYACRERVAALLLAGDIVNASKAFIPVIGPLTRGLEKLGVHDIPVYAVAGNHDVELLAHLANLPSLESFVVLGKNGDWEMATVTVGNETVDIWGKSFTADEAEQNPARSFVKKDLRSGIPALGLLHCDLNASGGAYAPIKREDLMACGIRNWVLGHIHLPTPLPSPTADTNVFYTGSPLPLDAGERGHHGPCLLEFDGNGKLSSVERLAMSPLRYEYLQVDVDEAKTFDEVQGKTVGQIQKVVHEALAENSKLKHLSLRIKLVGRSPLQDEKTGEDLKEYFDDAGSGALHDRVSVYVDRVTAAFAPMVELEQYRKSPKPLGVAADLIAELDGDTEMKEDFETVLSTLVEDLVQADSNTFAGVELGEQQNLDAIKGIVKEKLNKLAHSIHDQKAGGSS